MPDVGEARSLIFQNVANDVPVEDIMAAFGRSRLEIDNDVQFVAKKIREYRFRRRMPPISADTLADIRFNRVALLETLVRLGPNYLTSELILPRIGIQKIDSPSIAKEAAQRAGARVT